jgi:hypothetical protein
MRALLVASAGIAGLGLVACGPGDDGGGGECSGLVLGDLVITEVLADYGAPSGASGADEGKEWFEIHNASSTPIELAGLTLEHSRPDDEAPDRKRHAMRAITIPANGYITLGNVLPDLAPDHISYGYADALGDLYNTGSGRLALVCGTTLVDEATYDGVEVGRAFALDGGSPPDGQANDELANWCTSDESAALEYEPANYGTPGAANPDCMVVLPGQCDDNGTMRPTVPPQVGDIAITEVMPDPAAVTDTEGEWFEIVVNADRDLNGIAVAGATGNGNVLMSPSCVRVTAGTHVIFARNGETAMNGGLPAVTGTFTFTMANTAGTVRVLMDGTELDSTTWANVRSGRSLQLDMGLTAPTDNDLSTNFCDGNAAFGGGDMGSPGAANRDCGVVTTGMCMDTGTQQLRPIVKPTAGQLVINEWMPDPTHVADASGEWFELRATADVDLNGIQGGNATLGTTPLIPAAGDCVRVTNGSYALFARVRTNATAVPPTDNGLPSDTNDPPVVGLFGFGLTNGASSFQIGIDGANLATATWGSASVAGSSWMLDSDGTQCTANTTTPAAVPAYDHGILPGTDRGTPGLVNSPPDCP